jgi:hypothetical protein
MDRKGMEYTPSWEFSRLAPCLSTEWFGGRGDLQQVGEGSKLIGSK